ncbi:MAG: ADP-ribosylglycohydrolase family protein [Planctomycetota bacterium]
MRVTLLIPWLGGLLMALAMLSGCRTTSAVSDDKAKAVPTDRVRGMLLGSLIGDAAGGPVEFVPDNRIEGAGTWFRVWRGGERLEPSEFAAYGAGLELLDYSVFRPEPEPYAHWVSDAPAGTVTDDSRQKFIVVEMIAHELERAGTRGVATLDEAALARAYLRWERAQAGTPTEALNEEWVREYMKAARWVVGIREDAAPPSRLWGGIPTCAGQMALPPIAGAFPGDPEGAYRASYRAAFIDNAEARDLNAAIVAGLAAALAVDAEGDPWLRIKAAMIETDPWRYAEVPWVERSVPRWIRFAEDAAVRAQGEPAALKRIIEEELGAETWWEAHTTFTMALCAMEFCGYDPMASMRVAIELGYDTDSTAQMVGMFMGAVYGSPVFPERLREPVEHRLGVEYDESVDAWVRTLEAAAGRVR